MQIEENYRMGNTKDFFKKIRDTKGTFHAKMGSINNRNGMDLTEEEDIKKRCQEYTEEGFLISSCHSLKLCIQMLVSFLFSFAFLLSSFHSYL